MAKEHDHSGMASRGVSRPMADHASMEGSQQQPAGHEHGRGSMGHGDRLQMLHMHHQQTLWVYWTIVMLAFWQICAPFTFGYLNASLWVNPSGGRGVWFSEQPHTVLRAWLMTWSDVASGILLLALGWRSLTPNRPKSLWGCCFVGVWLTLAPVLFWAPTASAYLNDTIVRVLLIALTILIPGMPSMMMYMQHGPPTPPGWSYNPSSWPQRWIMIALGFAGWLVSRYLAMFQLGYIDYVWDPLFGFAGGTKKVLNSNMSHMWPLSDAALGGVAYTLEFLMGFMGGPARWRTMPWMVAFFGVLVIPLGLTHIVLVISQPVIVHEWCALCLLAAMIMLPMIPLEVDEVVAMLQHLRQAKNRGDRDGSLWKIFWMGGKADGSTPDKRSPELATMPGHPWEVFKASVWGMSFPWSLLASTAIGIVILLLPTLFGIEITSTVADIGHRGGALIVTVAVISMGEVVRIGRYLNVLFGAIVVVGPWLVSGAPASYAVACSMAGLATIGLSMPRGPKTESYGAWDRWVR